MSIPTIKKALLTGTALVAVSLCVANVAQAADAATPVISTTYTTTQTGGAGTNQAPAAGPGVVGGNADDGVEAGANNITITNNGTTLSGGTGGTGSTGNAATEPGAAGGTGGHGVNLPGGATDGTSTTTHISVINNTSSNINGGAGGTGGNGGGTDSDGANGGNAGSGINADSNFATITNNGTITGGNGGTGGNGTGIGNNGNGGAAGAGISVIATNVGITNTGTISAGTGGNGGTGGSGTGGNVGATSYAIDVQSGATGATINNSGTINGMGGIGVNIAETLGAAGFVNSGTINGTTGTGVFIAATKSSTVFNNTGTISATTGTALNVQGTLGTLTNLGTVTSSGNTNATMILGADQTSAGSLTLNGTLTNTHGSGTALSIAANQTTTGSNAIINTGTIGATSGGTAVDFSTFTGRFSNAGTVTGNITGGANAQQVVNTAGTITGNINLGAGNNSVTVSGGTVNGDITTTTNDDTITTSGTGTINGNINVGDGANALNLGGTSNGTITGGTAIDTVTMTGTHTGAVNLGADNDVLNLNAGGSIVGAVNMEAGTNAVNFNRDYTLSGSNTLAATGGTIDATIANSTTLNVSNTVSQLRNLSNSGAASVLNVNSNLTGTGALTNNGRINIANGVTLGTATMTAGAGSTINFNIDRSAGNMTSGVLNVSGGTATLTGSNIIFTVADSVGALPNNVVNFVTTSGGATLPAGANISDTSVLYDLATGTSGNNLTVTATRVAGGAAGLAGSTNNGNNAAVGAVFDAQTANANTQIFAAQGKLSAATSTAAVNDILESVGPTIDGSAVAASNTVTTQTQNLTIARLGALRNASNSGVSSGDAMANGRIWLQPFASTVDQDARDGIDGYTADTYGVALGADTDTLFDDTVIGVAVAYGNTTADSDNINSTNSDIDSYQVQLYADHELGNRAFIEGSLGYGRNQVDQTRHNVGGLGANADADYSSNQYIAAASIGQTYTPLANTPAFELTPRAGVRYTHLTTDSYSETGAGGLNLNVDTQDKDALEFSVGTEAAYNITTSAGTMTPAVHVGYTYDAIGDDIQASSRFNGGGAAFNTNGADPAQSTFNAGAGLTWYSNADFDLSINYDAQLKQDYLGHAGYVKAVRKF